MSALLEDGDQGLLERVAPEVFDHDVDPLLADAFLRDPRHHLVAAIADDRIVGFVSALDYWHPDKPRELWFNEVGVAPAWQHRGVGTQLLQKTLRARAGASPCPGQRSDRGRRRTPSLS